MSRDVTAQWPVRCVHAEHVTSGGLSCWLTWKRKQQHSRPITIKDSAVICTFIPVNMTNFPMCLDFAVNLPVAISTLSLCVFRPSPARSEIPPTSCTAPPPFTCSRVHECHCGTKPGVALSGRATGAFVPQRRLHNLSTQEGQCMTLVPRAT